jgi:hypothetical protein
MKLAAAVVSSKTPNRRAPFGVAAAAAARITRPAITYRFQLMTWSPCRWYF